ncbi:MAG TPA: FG-GAP-like repeat-containing protein [Polyangia bacterium]|jgi:RHS repeat-associated protein
MAKRLIWSRTLGGALAVLALLFASAGAAKDQGSGPSTTVNASAGSLISEVPIGAPTFRGIEPKLALSYSSAAGNGVVGVGWALGGLSVIERASPGRRAPRWNAADTYTLDGNELLPCATFGGTHCTRVESYQRITQSGNTWYVWRRDGTKATYAPLLNSVLGTYRWALATVEDTYGNAVTYNYWCDGWPRNECYLGNVQYNGATIVLYYEGRGDPITYGLGAPTEGTGQCSDTCMDSCSSETWACNVRTCETLARVNYRLKTIDVTVSGSRARAYQIVYAQSANSGRSVVQSVRQFGRDATLDGSGSVTGGTAVPAMTLGTSAPANSFEVWNWNSGGDWSGFESIPGDFNGDGKTDIYLHGRQGSGWADYLCLSNGTSFSCSQVADPGAWNGYELLTGDFNGDGKTDIYLHGRFGTGLADYMGLSQGSTFQLWTWAPGANWSDYNVITGDFNGDGKTDILLQYRVQNNTYPAVGGIYLGLSNGAGFGLWNWSYGGSPTMAYGWGYVRVSVGDVNGDGLDDIIVTGTMSSTPGIAVGLSSGSGFATWSSVIDDGTSSNPTTHPVGSPVDASLNKTKQSVYVGDFNGDGKADLLFMPDDSIGYWDWYNCNYGDYYGPALALSTGTGFQRWTWNPGCWDWRNYEVRVADFNGDGRTDLMLHGRSGSGGWTYLGLSVGTGFSFWNWSSGGDWSGYQPVAGDFNGDGKADFFMNGRSGTGAWGYLALMTNQGVRPDLVTAINNGLGGSTTIAYTPSSTWSNTSLPVGMTFPTVASVTVSDGRGDTQATSYTYQGARYDVTAREFLGFRRAVTTVSTTGAYSETYYWQRVGTIAKPEAIYKRAANGAVLSFDTFRFTENAAAPYQSLLTEMWAYECNGGLVQGTQACNPHPCNPHQANTRACNPYQCNPHTQYCTESCGYTWECGTAYDTCWNTCSDTVYDTCYDQCPDAAQYQSGCRRVLTTYAWDQFANMTAEYQYGDYDVAGDERTAVRSFAPNLERYIVGYPAYEHMYAGIGTAGQVLARTRFLYDGATAEATPPTRARLTKKGLWHDQTGGYVEHTFGYDAFGNETSVTDPLGRTATKTYDPTYHLFVTSTVNPVGHEVRSEWDPVLGAQLRTWDADGNVTTHTYDTLGRPATTTKPDGSQIRVEHLDWGNPNLQRERTSTLMPGGAWVWDDEYFDGVGRAYQALSSTGVVSTTTFGPNGQVVEKVLPRLAGEPALSERYEHDALGRLTRTRYPDGATVTRTYGNGYGTATDALGNVRTSWFDAAGRITQAQEIIDGAPRQTAFRYDLLGRRTWSRDAAGAVTLAAYDSLGRVLQKSDPDKGLWHYGYDALGRITTETDALGHTTTLVYDAAGRVTRRTYHDGTFDTYVFDEAGRGSSRGRLTTSTSASGVTTRAWYDAMGRRTRYEQVVDGVTYAISHTYDVAGRPVTATYPDGEVVTFGYGTAGLTTGKLVSVTGSVAGTLVSNVGYTSRGKAVTVSYGNGVTTSTGLDATGERVTSISFGALGTIGYGYDGNGRITSMTSAELASTNWGYEYDSIGRLTRATNLIDANATQTFAYDAVGRMLCNSKRGAYTYGDAAHAHAVTGAGSETYSYDANGNMLGGAGRSFTYNLDHRPATISYGSSTTSFDYDAQGVRVKKTGAGGPTVHVGSLYEARGAEITKYYFAGALRVAKRTGAGNQYFHADHLGSTRMITDQAGKEVKYYDYAPYGKVIAESGTASDSHRYTGQEAEDETGLMFYQARHYDPSLGRFVQADSLVPDANSPQSLDLYAYANNNPINYVDPSGHAAVGAFIAAVVSWVAANYVVVAVCMVVIGTALTFTDSPFLQSLGMIMASVGGAILMGGNPWVAGLVALAQSPISPLDPTVKKIIGWAYTVYGFVQSFQLAQQGTTPMAEGLSNLGSATGSQTLTNMGNSLRASFVSLQDKIGTLGAMLVGEATMTAAGWAMAYFTSQGSTGVRWAAAFIGRAAVMGTSAFSGPLAVIGATYDLAFTLAHPDGRVIDLSGGSGGEAFTFYYHTGYESAGISLGRQHIRVGDPRGGYYELGDAKAGWFGPGLGWGGWVSTQKITVIMSPAQAAAFRGALQKGAEGGGAYEGYHRDSYYYISASLQFATGKSAADLSINPGLLHW